MRRPAVLLFDLGGVLVENVGFERLNALLPMSLSLEELKTRWLASTSVRSFEIGACSSDSFASALAQEVSGLPTAASASAFIGLPSWRNYRIQEDASRAHASETSRPRARSSTTRINWCSWSL